ncbi:MAG: ribonuclease HII [Tepidanaerobacter acetatoxydans]|uniref:ribonuclease HII n=1 Tax=Tepidanaerobacter TaxID=499228 RepID=UPI000B027539|nr:MULTISPECIES: ribonuclease HII [Tepidanaerobacter]NLU10917.1 ribonuclease HII [Tepidanaerobacter acetatoxydans]
MDIEKERARILKLYDRERKLKQEGFTLVAGIDEAGRGPLAGPVVAAAVILVLDTEILNLKDSKKISEKKREEVYEDIKKRAVAYAYDVIDADYIDKYNILNSTLMAMKNAVEKLPVKPEYILVDALKIPDIAVPQESIIHGDNICACIAAASIVAKVERDRIMRKYDLVYPEYGFIRNKGYGTKEHINSIKKHGICPIHRRSFSVKGLEIQN